MINLLITATNRRFIDQLKSESEIPINPVTVSLN